MRVSMKSVLKSLGLIAGIVLVLGVFAGLLSGPARAQAPRSEPGYIELSSSPPVAPKEPEIEYDVLSSKEGRQTGLTSAGYLRIIAVDGYSGRAMPGHTFHVYDRNNEVVAEVTSDCSGAVQLDDLPTGYYNVQAQYSDGDPYIAYGGSRSQWLFVGAGRSASIRFYSYPAIRMAGIRVYAYDIYSYDYLEGMPFTVYDYSGSQVFSGLTNCSGFVDFFEVSPGWYRVVAGTGQSPDETPTLATETPPPPLPPGFGFPGYSDPGERWVLVYPSYLVTVDFTLDPSAYPQGTETPVPGATVTETPGPGSPTATPGVPGATPTAVPSTATATPTVTVTPGAPPPPPPP
jgi:hypothetical protein